MSNYWQFRDAVARRFFPRESALCQPLQEAFRPKGRKTHYREFNLAVGGWTPRKRVLSEGRMKHFLELSVNASFCPMPLNLDVWDAPRCPFGCIYCFADRYRESLYTSFYDEVKKSLRFCSKEFLKEKLDKWMKNLKKLPEEAESPIGKLIAMRVPIRFGIRFENFLPREVKEGISLYVLQYLRDRDYPIMVNTKSDIPGRDEYLAAMVENKGGAALHMTLLTANPDLAGRLEPHAPGVAARLATIKRLTAAGIQVVARHGPFLPFITDGREDLDLYAQSLLEAGCKDVTIDPCHPGSYSDSVHRKFLEAGLDGRSSVRSMSTTQFFQAALLDKYVEELRQRGMKVSASMLQFVSSNAYPVCCASTPVFGDRYSHGCTLSAVRFIADSPSPVSWKDYSRWVHQYGGFLSADIERQVRQAWNMQPESGALDLWASCLRVVSDTGEGLVWSKEVGNLDYQHVAWENLL
jgi:DNA repair photolyase